MTARSLRETIDEIIQADITLTDKAARFHALVPERPTLDSGKHLPEHRIESTSRGLFGLALDWVWPVAQNEQSISEKISALYILSSMYTQAVELDPFRGVYNDVWVSGRLASDITLPSSSTSLLDTTVLSTVGLILLLGRSHLIKHLTPSSVIHQCPLVKEVVRPKETRDHANTGGEERDRRSPTLKNFESTVWLSLGALSRSLGIKERKNLSRSLSQITPGLIPGLFTPSEIPPLVLSNPSIGTQVLRYVLSPDKSLDFPHRKLDQANDSAQTEPSGEDDTERGRYASALGALPPTLSSLDVFSNLFRSPVDPLTAKSRDAAGGGSLSSADGRISTSTFASATTYTDSGRFEEERKREEAKLRELLKSYALGRFVSNFINELDRLDNVRGEEEQVGRLVRILSLFLSNLLQTPDLVLPETILIESTSFALRFSRFKDAQRLYVLLSSSSSSSSSSSYPADPSSKTAPSSLLPSSNSSFSIFPSSSSSLSAAEDRTVGFS